MYEPASKIRPQKTRREALDSKGSFRNDQRQSRIPCVPGSPREPNQNSTPTPLPPRIWKNANPLNNSGTCRQSPNWKNANTLNNSETCRHALKLENPQLVDQQPAAAGAAVPRASCKSLSIRGSRTRLCRGLHPREVWKNKNPLIDQQRRPSARRIAGRVRHCHNAGNIRHHSPRPTTISIDRVGKLQSQACTTCASTTRPNKVQIKQEYYDVA